MKKKIYLKYLFNDNGPDAHLNPEIVKGIIRESREYGKDPDAEYIPLNPFIKKHEKGKPDKSGASHTEAKGEETISAN